MNHSFNYHDLSVPYDKTHSRLIMHISTLYITAVFASLTLAAVTVEDLQAVQW